MSVKALTGKASGLPTVKTQLPRRHPLLLLHQHPPSDCRDGTVTLIHLGWGPQTSPLLRPRRRHPGSTGPRDRASQSSWERRALKAKRLSWFLKLFPTGGAGNNTALRWRPQQEGEKRGPSPGSAGGLSSISGAPVPAAPDPPRWKETGQWRLRARARRGLTEAKAGSRSRRRPGGPLRPLLRAARRATSPATLCATRRLLGLWESGNRAPAQPRSPRTEALGASRTRRTRAPGRPPAGAPHVPPAPRRPRSPPPRRCSRGAGPRVQPQTRRGSLGTRQPGRGATMEEPQRPRSHTVTTTASSFAENFSTSSSSFAYDREFLRTLPGLLIVAEIVSAGGLGVAGAQPDPGACFRRVSRNGVCSDPPAGFREPFLLSLAFFPKCKTQTPLSKRGPRNSGSAGKKGW
ncbi:uncharacterized protein LOC120360845 [Saimiri boliviensis]|uniref:uncharacterized protein LOC120360845 n=1 Tax=Saimiri boliviensis TaxID=27679 RepID=UPI003D77722E